MRAVEVSSDGALERVDHDDPVPAADEIRIEVAACGVCRGDTAVTEGRPV